MKPYKNIAAMTISICLLAGCVPEVGMPAGGKTIFRRLDIPEAYLRFEMSPEETNEPAETSPVESSAPTDTPVYATTEVSLEDAGFEGVGLSLYRLNGSYYMITKPVEENADIKKGIMNCANLLNGIQQSHPDVRFYTYYITRATDCNWFRKTENIAAYDYAAFFREQLGNTQITSGQYTLSNLKDYMDTGYKTDFHVNYKGSYAVYSDVYDMLSNDFEMSGKLAPAGENGFDGLKMVGDLFDKATGPVSLSNDEMDDFVVYTYGLGEYKSYVNDVEMAIGLEEEYASGQIDRDPGFEHQFSYYGGQSGVVRFEFGHPDKPNLLILSDSQGRPSRKLLAYHFNTTIFLDDKQWRSEDIGRIIEDNDIDAVILMGQKSMFEIYG